MLASRIACDAVSSPAVAVKLKIVSGGQTGVDRAALDFAIENGIQHGGWCPQGRLAEDGTIPPCYRLNEIPNPSYSERTERNVLESDGTLIIARGVPLSEGTLFTQDCARKHSKPCLVVHESDGLENAAREIEAFLKKHKIELLNVAGPRESQAPGLGKFVRRVLSRSTQKAT
jgi:putative molybdenum carrier protein